MWESFVDENYCCCEAYSGWRESCTRLGQDCDESDDDEQEVMKKMMTKMRMKKHGRRSKKRRGILSRKLNAFPLKKKLN